MGRENAKMNREKWNCAIYSKSVEKSTEIVKMDTKTSKDAKYEESVEKGAEKSK